MKIPLNIKTLPENFNQGNLGDIKKENPFFSPSFKKSKWLKTILILAGLFFLIIAYFFAFKPGQSPPYSDIMPENRVFFGIFKKDFILPRIESVRFFNNPDYLKAQEILKQNSAFAGFLKDEIGIAGFAQNQWAIFLGLKKEIPSAMLHDIESSLKNSFNIAADTYREISLAKLSRPDDISSYFYINTGKYIVIANERALLLKIIDLLVKE